MRWVAKRLCVSGGAVRGLVSATLTRLRFSCTPCSNFGINTTLLTGGRTICANYGVRGTTCAPAGYTREATFFGTIDRNIQSFRTVYVINKGGRGTANCATPYKMYHRIVVRFYGPGAFGVVLTVSERGCEICALRSVLPRKFKPTGLR